jgi:DNA-binding MarR family transcriptional regulator
LAVGTTRWLTETEQTAWRAILEVSVRLLERLDADLQAAHQLSLSEYEILVHLSASPIRRLRMRELADQALVSRSRLTHTVNRMEERGLVSRERCEEDRRGLFAVLTDEGMALLESAAPTHVAGVRRHLIDCIPPEDLDAVVAVFAAAQRSLCGNVSAFNDVG